jgi:hypothetical protein
MIKASQRFDKSKYTGTSFRLFSIFEVNTEGSWYWLKARPAGPGLPPVDSTNHELCCRAIPCSFG